MLRWPAPTTIRPLPKRAQLCSDACAWKFASCATWGILPGLLRVAPPPGRCRLTCFRCYQPTEERFHRLYVDEVGNDDLQCSRQGSPLSQSKQYSDIAAAKADRAVPKPQWHGARPFLSQRQHLLLCRTSAPSAIIHNIHKQNCWHVLDIYKNSAHYFEWRSSVASKAFAAHQIG
jgi:hypothetical protein